MNKKLFFLVNKILNNKLTKKCINWLFIKLLTKKIASFLYKLFIEFSILIKQQKAMITTFLIFYNVTFTIFSNKLNVY